MKHKGEPIVIMSGEHGAFTIEDGDELPEWFAPPTDKPKSARIARNRPAEEAQQ